MQSSGQPPEAPPSKHPTRAGETASPVAGQAAAAPARKYPKPPPLHLRLAFLCLKPEAWAAAASYPTRFTVAALVIAVLVMTTVVGVANTVRVTGAFQALATDFPPMELSSAGILKAKEPLQAPLARDFCGAPVIIDPSDKTTLDTVGVSSAFLVTSHDIERRADGSDVHLPLSTFTPLAQALGWLPTGTGTGTIDGPKLRNAALALGAIAGASMAIVHFTVDLLLTVMLLFFLGPLITLTASIGEQRLLLPRRAAYRMAIAIMVPLMVLGGALDASGYSPIITLGLYGALLFWFLAGCGLGIWTGIMARRMFGPTRRGVPRQQ